MFHSNLTLYIRGCKLIVKVCVICLWILIWCFFLLLIFYVCMCWRECGIFQLDWGGCGILQQYWNKGYSILPWHKGYIYNITSILTEILCPLISPKSHFLWVMLRDINSQQKRYVRAGRMEFTWCFTNEKYNPWFRFQHLL